MSHDNARLTPAGRLMMGHRIQPGRAVAHVAAEMGISRTTAWRWWRRFRENGPAGLIDRSSAARTHPVRTGPCVETRIQIRRTLTTRGPVFIAAKLGMQASTVGRVLRRHHVPLLRDLVPVAGAVIRSSRYRRKETGPYPQRRRMAGRLDPDIGRSSHLAPQNGLRLRPHRHRRPLPSGLRRDP